MIHNWRTRRSRLLSHKYGIFPTTFKLTCCLHDSSNLTIWFVAGCVFLLLCCWRALFPECEITSLSKLDQRTLNFKVFKKTIVSKMAEKIWWKEFSKATQVSTNDLRFETLIPYSRKQYKLLLKFHITIIW